MLRDVLVDLVAGELAAFAGLGPLRHLDLQLVGVDEIVAGDAEAARRHLLDGAAPQVAVRVRQVAHRILAALAGVRLAAEPVHRDGEVLVRLAADRAERHGAGLEALHDLGRRLDLVERDRRAGLEAQQPADGAQPPALVVGERRVLLEHLVAARAHRVLQLRDGVRVVHVVLAAPPPLVLAAHPEVAVERRRDLVGVVVTLLRLAGDDVEPDALDARRRPGEVLVDDLAVEPDGLEDLRAPVAVQRRDAHLGHHLEDALVDRLAEVLHRLVGVDVLQHCPRPPCRAASRRPGTDSRRRRRRPAAGRSAAPRAARPTRRRCRSACGCLRGSGDGARRRWRAGSGSGRGARRRRGRTARGCCSHRRPPRTPARTARRARPPARRRRLGREERSAA